MCDRCIYMMRSFCGELLSNIKELSVILHVRTFWQMQDFDNFVFEIKIDSFSIGSTCWTREFWNIFYKALYSKWKYHTHY